MSPTQKNAIAGYVKNLLELFNMNSWAFTVVPELEETEDPDGVAVTTLYNNRYAYIYVDPDFFARNHDEENVNSTTELIGAVVSMLLAECKTSASLQTISAYLPIGVREANKLMGEEVSGIAKSHIASVLLPVVLSTIGGFKIKNEASDETN